MCDTSDVLKIEQKASEQIGRKRKEVIIASSKVLFNNYIKTPHTCHYFITYSFTHQLGKIAWQE